MKKWIIRKYRPGDEKQIINLFKLVYGKQMGKTESIKHWNWEYKKNPNNRIEIFLAIDKNKIIGHYAIIPMKMKIGNAEYIVSLSLDTMTHKRYRGQGIFPQLATNLYEDLGKNKIPITYGFPNSQSYKGFINKLNWFEISKVPIYIKPLNFVSIVNLYLKNIILSKFIGNILKSLFNLFIKKIQTPIDIEIKEFTKIGNEFDTLWNNTKNEIIVGIVRDQVYLNWRYLQKPEDNYIIYGLMEKHILRGYTILKIEERFNLKIGLIMDILTDPSDTLYQTLLVNHAVSYFKKKKVDIISVIIYPFSRYYKAFRKQRFFHAFKLFFPEDIYFGARINNSDVDFSLIKNPRNWYITWGDTDVV